MLYWQWGGALRFVFLAAYGVMWNIFRDEGKSTESVTGDGVKQDCGVQSVFRKEQHLIVKIVWDEVSGGYNQIKQKKKKNHKRP